jgi:hypothetical protein
MPAIVTFDGPNRRIIEIDAFGDNELDLVEIYSEWKEWVQSDPANAGIESAFRVVGGDPIGGSVSLGSTFFILNGWKIRPAESDHKLKINGNLFTEPAGSSRTVPTLGDFTVEVEWNVSNLTETIATGGGDPGAIADAVWDENVVAAHGATGTGGLLLRAVRAQMVLRYRRFLVCLMRLENPFTRRS